MSSIWSKLINVAGNVTGILGKTHGGTGIISTATFPSSGVVVTENGTETLTNKDLTSATNSFTAAGASATGVVTTGAQTLAGDKTLTGNTTLGTTSTSVTQTIANNSTSANPLVVKNADTTSGSDSVSAIIVMKGSTTSSTNQRFILFQTNAGGSSNGVITANGANTAVFTSTSDEKLKENIANLSGELINIMALRPVSFNYKKGIKGIGSGPGTGFIAQEMQKIYPDAVSEGPDGWLEISGWSKTEARLVKAIQELKADFDAYKASHS